MARLLALPDPNNGDRFCWAHLSTRGEAIRLRVRVGEELIERPLEGSPLDYVVVPAGEAVGLLAAKDETFEVASPPSYTDGAWWIRFLAKMDECFSDASSLATPQDQGASRPDGFRVPITALRFLYEQPETRRLMSADLATSQLILRALPILWRDSVRHFSPYANDEPFNQDRQPLELSEDAANPTRTNEVVANIQQAGGIGGGWEYAEREFSPWRTTGAVFEDGLPATRTGGGGVDLLFRGPNAEPGVGELKLEGDTSSAFALVQALTYAAELATTDQIERLKNHLPDAFGSIDPKSASVHVLLLIAAPDSDPTLADTLAAVNDLNSSSTPLERLGSVSIVTPDGMNGWQPLLTGR